MVNIQKPSIVIWKHIAKYPTYAVNNIGEVVSLETFKQLKQINTNGYNRVALYNKNGRKDFVVHRLIALIKSNNENKPFVNHINAIKTCNYLQNLEWCTAKENKIHALSLGLGSIPEPGKGCFGKYARRSLRIKCTFDNGHIYYFDSAKIASQKLGITHSWITTHAKSNRRMESKGISFEYIRKKP